MVNILARALEILTDSFNLIWKKTMVLIPGILAAIIVIVIGWIFAKIIQKIVRLIMKKSPIDRWIKRKCLSGALWGKDFSNIVASVLKWYILAIFVIQAMVLIKSNTILNAMSFLQLYVHRIFAAVFLLVGASLISEKLKKGIEDTKLAHSKSLATGVKYLILYFALVVILQLLGFQTGLLADVFKIAFTAFAITIAIILGIGFGLAFSEDFRAMIQGFKKK